MWDFETDDSLQARISYLYVEAHKQDQEGRCAHLEMPLGDLLGVVHTWGHRVNAGLRS
jgi:hypothetical protein